MLKIWLYFRAHINWGERKASWGRSWMRLGDIRGISMVTWEPSRMGRVVGLVAIWSTSRERGDTGRVTVSVLKWSPVVFLYLNPYRDMAVSWWAWCSLSGDPAPDFCSLISYFGCLACLCWQPANNQSPFPLLLHILSSKSLSCELCHLLSRHGFLGSKTTYSRCLLPCAAAAPCSIGEMDQVKHNPISMVSLGKQGA